MKSDLFLLTLKYKPDCFQQPFWRKKCGIMELKYYPKGSSCLGIYISGIFNILQYLQAHFQYFLRSWEQTVDKMEFTVTNFQTLGFLH